MKTLVVGDLHGRYEVAEAALDTGYPVIFVGDYLDSFTRSVEDQVETLRLVLEAIADGQAEGLLGNHELSYLDRLMRCSGFNMKTMDYVCHLDLTVLKPYTTTCEGFLISHAGVSQRLLDIEHISLDEYLEFGYYKQIGRVRGGFDEVGGLYWCDWNYEFENVPGVNQIVGHTRGKTIRSIENNFCIDCLEDSDISYGLLVENGKASPYEIKV